MSLRSASGRLRLPPARAVPRLVAAGLLVGLLLAADRVDPVAAGVAVAALVATGLLLRHRSRQGERRAVLVLGTGATIAAVLVALSLPVYRSRPDPLIVNIEASADQAAARAADSTTTTRPPTPVTSAGGAGAEGLLVISNYDGKDWNGGRVRALVSDKEARRRFVSAVSGAMARAPWDGVVLDFENLDASVRDPLATLVGHLAEALRRRRVLVTVPAFTDPDGDDAAPFDLARLSAGGVGIV